MKNLLFIIILLSANIAFGQTQFPTFLQGTWKTENKETYERWDKLNDETLKGFSYRMKDGQMAVSEYLEIAKKGNDIVYTATVLQQNAGKGIDFKLTKSENVYSFENPSHDFPKKISYQKLSETEVLVQVSDGAQKSFSYKIIKHGAKPAEKSDKITNPNYDAKLAEKLGSDDYGMKKYIFVILKTGSNQTTDKEFINEKFRGHMENMDRMVKEKKLVIAGPFFKNDRNYRGLFILTNVKDLEEAREILQTDPAIKEKLLEAELYDWYGSAALPEYLEFSDKVWKSKP